MPNQQNQDINEGNPKKSGSMSQANGVGEEEFIFNDPENAGAIKHTENYNRADAQVRENEDASLQDSSYTFDYDNTDSEEGIDDFDISDVGLDSSDDFV